VTQHGALDFDAAGDDDQHIALGELDVLGIETVQAHVRGDD